MDNLSELKEQNLYCYLEVMANLLEADGFNETAKKYRAAILKDKCKKRKVT